MSIFRSILSRPRRWREVARRRGPGGLVPAVAIVVGVTACTAVAADGLATGSGPGVALATASELDAVTGSQPGGWSTVIGEGEAAGRPMARRAGQSGISTAPEPAARPAKPVGKTATGPRTDRGTIVAHAATPTVVARRRPAVTAEPVARFANPTERGGPQVFQAIGEPRGDWIEVLLPVRPNGTTGWIHLDHVTLSRNPYRIEVDLGNHRLTVHRLDEIELSAPVAVGQGGTPTPVGDFYLIELLQPPAPDGPYGTYAYGLSGYSDVLDNFNGGDGVIGIHGTNRPDLLGGPASHGCIRVHNDTIESMAEFLPLGTPVSIIEADAG